MQPNTRYLGKVELSPSEIYFTQDSVAMAFQNGKELNETCEEIAKGNINVEQIPFIRVLHIDGKYFSVDNRRLYIFRVLEKLGLISTITAKRIDAYDRDITTQNEGCHIKLRSQKDDNDRWKRRVTYLHCSCLQQSRKSSKPGWWDVIHGCHVDQKPDFNGYREEESEPCFDNRYSYSSYNPQWSIHSKPEARIVPQCYEGRQPQRIENRNFVSYGVPPQRLHKSENRRETEGGGLIGLVQSVFASIRAWWNS